MHKLILHIPHSSITIPNYTGYTQANKIVKKEILKLTDWHTDDLFSGTEDDIVKADFSRIFCDVERFRDDEDEIMSQYGMGTLYEKTDDGQIMRVVSPELKTEILMKYYDKHHRKLNQIVNKHLLTFGKALIVDCHSYSDIPFVRDLNQDNNRPHFCIGTDTFHTPDYLIEASLKFFEERNYSVGLDTPYSGSIVPMEHYKKNKNVQSIMLEINRKLYLNDGTNEQSSTYVQTKEIVTEYLRMLKNFNVK